MAEDKYLKALEAPKMVAAFYSGDELEIGRTPMPADNADTSSNQNNPSIHPAASPYTVMARSVLPAVLLSGIDSDLPGRLLSSVLRELSAHRRVPRRRRAGR